MKQATKRRFTIPPQIACVSALPGETGNTTIAFFTRYVTTGNTASAKCGSASLEFNQSLLDFFSVFDSQLIFTLLYDALNLVINAFRGVVQEKGSREHCSTWTVLYAQSTSARSSGFPLSQGNAEAPDR